MYRERNGFEKFNESNAPDPLRSRGTEPTKKDKFNEHYTPNHRGGEKHPRKDK